VSIGKKAIYYAILAVIVVATSEILSSAFLFFHYRDRIAGLSGEPSGSATVALVRAGLDGLLGRNPAVFTRLSRLPDGFFAEDAEQGYRATPGRYVFRYTRQRDGRPQHIDTVVTINPDGTRFTGTAPQPAARQIFVLGDSFVFGDGVNDEQTFSFLLQSAFPRDAVRLQALGGWSWANALVSLRRLGSEIRPSDAIVLGYAAYYKERHVETPSRLRDIRNWMARSFPEVELKASERLVRARLEQGRLVLDTIPMHCKFNPTYCDGANPSVEDIDKVSIALLDAIAAATPGKIHLLHFFGPKDDPVLRRLPANVELIAATPADFNYVMRDDIMGFDDHGGPYWHYAMYSRLRLHLAHE
jgi:hypothetical protein